MKQVIVALSILSSCMVHGFVPAQTSWGKIRTTQLAGSSTLEGRPIDGALEPMNNFILVKVMPAQEETEGGILLAGKAKIEKTEGTVIAAGPGKTHQESGIFFPMSVEEGEGVVYGRFDGTELEYNGEKHTLIRDDDVLVKYRGDALTLECADVCHNNILVRVETKEAAESAGGILLAQTSESKTRPSTGTVVKVGPGRMASNGELMKMDVSPGDMIKFRDFAGNEVEIEKEDFSVVRMTDILAKF